MKTSRQTVTVEGRISNKIRRCQSLFAANEQPSLEYTQNNEREEECEAILQKFIQEHPDLQEKLFLSAENEFGIRKCLCSTLKPTLLPYPDIYNSKECAEFVSQFLEYESLDSCCPPTIVPSPTQVLEWGIGDSFDFAILLASFLLGAGYEAYVVFGSAPISICTKDTTCIDYPHSIESQIQEKIDTLKSMSNGNDLTTRPKLKMQTSSKDDLHSVHCWVLVRSNVRCEGTKDYYIEPTTGFHYSLDCHPYEEIYAIWNNKNYFVNTTQDKLFHSNLEDWLPVFGNTLATVPTIFNGDETEPPISWVSGLGISEDEYQNKYKNEGIRMIEYKNAKVELYAPQKHAQGLRKRIMFTESDGDCIDYIIEYFSIGSCKLRVRLPYSNWSFEAYDSSHKFSVKEWIENPSKERILSFHDQDRSDLLKSCREIFSETIIFEFEDRRRDRLREVIIIVTPLEQGKTKINGRFLLPSSYGSHNTVVTSVEERYSAPLKTTTSTEASQIAIRKLNLLEKSLETAFYSEAGSISATKVTHDEGSDKTKFLKYEKEILSTARKLNNDLVEIVRLKKKEEKIGLVSKIGGEVKQTSSASSSKDNKKDEDVGMTFDHLSPYLLDVKDPKNMTHEETLGVYEACVNALKSRCTARVNIIQHRLNEENSKLSELQNGCIDTSVDQKDSHENMANEISFRIKILEQRLSKSEKNSMEKLRALDIRLREDERMKSLSLGY